MPDPPLLALTGASGRVGRAFAEAARRRGRRVRALVHRRPAPWCDEQATVDLLTGEGLAAALAGADEVAHLAARTHARRVRDYDAVNVEGTRRLLDALPPGARLLHVSTRAVGEDGGAYARSKLRAEELVRRRRPDATIVRLPELYGAGGEGLDALLAAARRGRPILLVGDGGHELRPLSLEEAADALAAALHARYAGSTITLAGPPLTMRAAAEQAVAAYGSRSRIVGVPTALVRLACRASALAPLPVYPDQLARLELAKPEPSGEAQAQLGLAPEPFAAGLRRVRTS